MALKLVFQDGYPASLLPWILRVTSLINQTTECRHFGTREFNLDLDRWQAVSCRWGVTVLTKIVWPFNTLRPRQNYRHFPDDIFKCIFFNENVWISIEISLRFVPKCHINNIPALVQIMAWHRPGVKPLSEPMMVSSLTHICVSRPRWVKAYSDRHVWPFWPKGCGHLCCARFGGHKLCGLFGVWPFWQGSPVKNQMLHKGQHVVNN